MSRIRSIHPGLWTDDAFMALSAHARLLIIGIWTEAFDDGVFEWKPLTLKARIFPADAVDMHALLDELVAGAFVRREEFEGRQIGLVRNFREYQRPKKPNSSGMLRAEWGTYVGIAAGGGEPVPHQSTTGSEKSPQMEDGGGEEDVDPPPPSVNEAEGARAQFDELWSVFPQNPTSSETKAMAAFSATKATDRDAILAAARRYRQWFFEDCAARDRTTTAGVRFVPHLATWLQGAWQEAASLPVKSDPAMPAIPMTKLDRELDRDLWERCERLMGKKAPTSGTEWWFRTEVVEKARSEAMH